MEQGRVGNLKTLFGFLTRRRVDIYGGLSFDIECQLYICYSIQACHGRQIVRSCVSEVKLLRWMSRIYQRLRAGSGCRRRIEAPK